MNSKCRGESLKVSVFSIKQMFGINLNLCYDFWSVFSFSSKNIDRIKIGRRTGYDVKKWRFPLTTVCPEPKCQRLCRSRELAINHYKTRHADQSGILSNGKT